MTSRWYSECGIKCIGNYVYPPVFVEVKYFLSRSILPPSLPPNRPSHRCREVGGNGARSGAGFTRGRESFTKTFPLINLVYRWAGSGDACALRSRQNFKYGQLSKFTRDVSSLRAPARLRASRDSAAANVVWPTSIIGKKRDAWQPVGKREE